MNYPRLALSGLGAFFAYFVFGFLAFAILPLKSEFQKYPGVYRSQEGIKAVMPLGMFGMLVSLLALTILYALVYRGGSGPIEGLRFGALIGIFAIGSFVLHNYVNLNIGLKLALQHSAMYFLEWVIVGLVIGLIYKPALPAAH
jgi:hypothetical protein